MRRSTIRHAAANHLYVFTLVAVGSLGVLSLLLFRGAGPRPAGETNELLLFSAAGLRYPMDQIVAEYQKRYGVSVQVQYGGSNTLLNQLEIARTGDLYLAADESYIDLAREKGLSAEVIPLSWATAVIVVPKGNPKQIRSVDDLLRDDVTVALGNPEAAAIGKTTRELLEASGHWSQLEPRVTRRGVFKPTVNDVANDVKLGSVDAGIVWDSTAVQYPDLMPIEVPQLAAGRSMIEIAVLNSTRDSVATLRFARFVSARDEGLRVFREHGFEVVEGDIWEESPEMTFFAGSVNRRVLEPIVSAFEKREGVRVNTIYNGCGILTAQMKTIQEAQGSGFPDTYMACDVYYLDVVKDWFQDAVNVSETGIVIAVQEGNPKSIRGLSDLVRPGVRVAVGQPDQCTIGVLTRTLLQRERIYDELIRSNVVTQTATSALLVPSVTTGAADAALAYETDTLAEQHRIDVIRIDSPLAKAIQPFSIARSSQHKFLGRRLFEQVSKSREVFESKGFRWRVEGTGAAQVPGTGEAAP